MAMKDWFRQMRPLQLYIVLALTTGFFFIELVVGQLTHALVLQMDSYQMLCNILALSGCLITMKYGCTEPQDGCTATPASKTSESSTTSSEELVTTKTVSSPTATCHDQKKKPKTLVTRAHQERKLKNTFGWARIDIIMMLICCVFLSSFAFSIVVEALQTLAHIDHQDAMHHPMSVMCIGIAGILLNIVCYALIGGYTFHHASYLRLTATGDVVLDRVVVAAHGGGRRLSRTRRTHPNLPVQTNGRLRQGAWETLRDVTGSLLVIICSITILFIDKSYAKFIDPLLSLASVCIIMTLSYPYMKESCLILLQTMPDTIDIDSLKADLLKHFPDIVNVHDVHVWQLTANKVISTVHIIFQNPKVYNKIMDEVKNFFLEYGITQVTIQPEFFKSHESNESLNKRIPDCLMACQGEMCKENHCCPDIQEKEKDKKLFKRNSKEVLPESWTPDLKSVRIMNDEAVKSYSISSSLTSTLTYDEVKQNEINKSFNELSKKRDLVNNKIIAASEARIDAKIDRILSRNEQPVCQNVQRKDEERILNETVYSKSSDDIHNLKTDNLTKTDVKTSLQVVCEHKEEQMQQAVVEKNEMEKVSEDDRPNGQKTETPDCDIKVINTANSKTVDEKLSEIGI